MTHKSLHKDFYALNGLSFTVEKGQTVGSSAPICSGKSTILKIITGVLTPTTGSVQVDGKISALLELGAGFNMDYTGIENIYMNGTMMGYTKAEMDKKLQEIFGLCRYRGFCLSASEDVFQRYVRPSGLCPGHQRGAGDPYCGRGPVCGRCVFPGEVLPAYGGDPEERHHHLKW